MTLETKRRTDSLEFSAKSIRMAVQTLRPMLGDASVDAIIYDLELYGLLLNQRGQYSIDQIQTALERIFGEATALLVTRIKKTLLETKN